MLPCLLMVAPDLKTLQTYIHQVQDWGDCAGNALDIMFLRAEDGEFK
jgi:hypothetical protein